MNDERVASCQLSVASAEAANVRPMPTPRVPVHVRPATIADVPFMDGLQKLHAKQVGWMPTKQFEGKIKLGHVLVAEEVRDQKSEVGDQKSEVNRPSASLTSDLCPLTSAPDLQPLTSFPVGYCIGHDQYFKRDDCGIIYQLNVAPGHQRGLIGATLLKAMFDRAAYGCRLFCCWCAQDIAANHFWEAMGFVPLAFRSGSRGKRRTHIFWQRRVRAGDTTTPYWFPAQTSAGSIREDRLVLPIPPGTHWRDVMPILLPAAGVPAAGMLPSAELSVASCQLSVVEKKKRQPRSALATDNSQLATPTLGRLSFAPPAPPKVAAEAPKKAPRPKVKNDPKHVAAARELRDRWLEQVNTGTYVLEGQGKYDVSRAMTGGAGVEAVGQPIGPAARQLPSPAGGEARAA